jgi:hypothetical protein
MVEKDVMDGRSRIREASTTASRTFFPPAELIGVLDDQDGVLGHQPDQHDESDLGEDVEALLEHEERYERPHHRQGHGQENGDGVDEALELGGQDQIDEHHGEEEEEIELGAGGPELQRLPGELVLDPGGEIGGGDPIQVPEGGIQVHPRSQVGGQGGRADAVVVIELLGGHGFLDLEHVGELDEPPRASNVELLDDFGSGAPGRTHLGDDVVLFGATLEFAHRPPPEEVSSGADVVHGTPRAEARSRSMDTSSCGLLRRRSLSRLMRYPSWDAFAS